MARRKARQAPLGNAADKAARIAHTKALGGVQAFSLTGDGANTDGLLCAAERGEDFAGELAAARYRDWRASQGELFARFRDAGAPDFELTADNGATGGTAGGNGAGRLRLAVRILADLLDEFGDLFPDEFAATKAFLGE